MYMGDDNGKSKKRANGEEDVNPTKKQNKLKNSRFQTLFKTYYG